MSNATPEYLGDSVYAELEPGGTGMIVLTTRNGFPTDPSNEIFLEPEVLEALVLFARRHGVPVPEAEPGDDLDRCALCGDPTLHRELDTVQACDRCRGGEAHLRATRDEARIEEAGL